MGRKSRADPGTGRTGIQDRQDVDRRTARFSGGGAFVIWRGRAVLAELRARRAGAALLRTQSHRRDGVHEAEARLITEEPMADRQPAGIRRHLPSAAFPLAALI